jgi:hypothetical protein
MKSYRTHPFKGASPLHETLVSRCKNWICLMIRAKLFFARPTGQNSRRSNHFSILTHSRVRKLDLILNSRIVRKNPPKWLNLDF